MPTCSVTGCTKEKRNAIDPDHKFFSFPRKSPLIEKWIKFCRKDSLTKEQCMTKGQRVCSIHFKEEYIEIPLKYRLLPQFAPKNMRMLRKDAVPTIRNPKKRKEDEEGEKQRQKKLEYSRIVAELLEQSEKDAAAEKERQEKEAAEATVNQKESSDKEGDVTHHNVKQEESTPAGKKTPKSKKQSSRQKSPKKMKIEHPSPETTKDTSRSKKGNDKSVPATKNSKSKSSDQKKKVSFADPDLQDQQRPDTDDEIEVYELNFQSEDADSMNNCDQQAEDNAAELLRLQRENKKLTDLTIKQSLQIADLIKQRNDLWREKGDLWFRKRMDPQSGGVSNVS